MSLTSFLTGTLIPALKANNSGRVQWGNVADEIARLLGADTAAAFGPYINLGVTAGSTNQYTIPGAQTPSNFDLNDGLLIGFITDRVNTSSGGNETELKIDTLSAKKILKPSGSFLINAEIPASYFVLCAYDSSLDSGSGAFVLLNPLYNNTFTNWTPSFAIETGSSTPTVSVVNIWYSQYRYIAPGVVEILIQFQVLIGGTVNSFYFTLPIAPNPSAGERQYLHTWIEGSGQACVVGFRTSPSRAIIYPLTGVVGAGNQIITVHHQYLTA